VRIEAVVPNPAAGVVPSAVRFTLPVASHAVVDVFDVRGARVRRLFAGEAPAGPSTLAWDGCDDRGRRAAAGLYFVALGADGRSARSRVVRLP